MKAHPASPGDPTAAPAEGAPEHWLARSFLLDGKGGGSPVDPQLLSQWQPSHGDIWLHLNLTDPDARRWLAEQSGIEEIAVESLLDVESRPRLTRVGKAALMALRGVNFNPGEAADDMIGVRIWLEQHRVITSYRRRLRSVEDVITSLHDGVGPLSAGEVITDLARYLVTRMTETVDSLEAVADDLEEQLIDDDAASETRLELSRLRRKIIGLRRYMAPQREALASLVASKLSWIGEDLRLSLRETNDRLSRHLEDLDAIRERAAVTQEELQNRLTERQNMRMYVLSIVTAIFLPLGFLTGLLGINIGGMPGADNPAAFGVFSAFLAIVILAQILFFRTRKWF